MRPIALFLALALAAPLAAQEPARPSLPRGADANDWEAYFAAGDDRFARFPAQSAAAFYWASRLDPTRAEPLFAMWAAFWKQDEGLWLQYLDEDQEVLRRASVAKNDSLLTRAFNRNPFVHRGLEVALFVGLGRRLRVDGATAAFINYGEADFRDAAAGFGRVIRANPGRHLRLRHYRALAFVGDNQLDSAAVEIQTLLETLRARDAAYVGYAYESKAMYEYALGRLQEARNRPSDARAAFERALEEDLSMYPARAALARLHMGARQFTEAVDHMAQATETAPDDGVMHYEHGHALAAAGRRDEAIAAMKRATELEPYWALPLARLGQLNDLAGNPAEALAAYQAYLERAPRSQAETASRVRQRIAALRGG